MTISKATALLIFGLSCGAAMSQPGPLPGSEQVNPAFNQADLVCFGSVTSLIPLNHMTTQRGHGQVTIELTQATISVARVYKGSAPDHIQISFEQETPSTRGDMPTVRVGEHQLLFLRRIANVLTFSDPYLGAIRLHELSAGSSQESGIIKLREALLETLQRSSTEDESIRLMELLEGIQPSTTQIASLAARMSRYNNQKVAIQAMLLWLHSDRPAAMSALSDFLTTQSANMDGVQIAKLTNEILKASSDVPLNSIVSLTASNLTQVRFAAALTMRNRPGDKDFGVLIRLLDDPDLDVEYEALICLAESTGKNGDYGPNMAVFTQNPQRFRKLWKDWWTRPANSMTRRN